MALLHIITLVIPTFCPFRSISYRFLDNNFFLKNINVCNFLNMALLHIMIAPAEASLQMKWCKMFISRSANQISKFEFLHALTLQV